MKILLTGFNPFGRRDVNPSQRIIELMPARLLHNMNVTAEVLRTEFAASGVRIRELINDLQPDVVVMLGQAAGRGVMSLERVALNLNDTTAPDNAGDCPTGRLIALDGPAAYWSTLPLEPMKAALQNKNIPVGISNHAGTFVCNHVFYSARHIIEQAGLRVRCGFIHVPLTAEETDDRTKELPLSMMLVAVETCLEVIQREHQVEATSL